MADYRVFESTGAENPSGAPGVTEISPKRSGAEHGSEFDRFGDLTRKLVQIPKEEVDEKRKKKA